MAKQTQKLDCHCAALDPAEYVHRDDTWSRVRLFLNVFNGPDGRRFIDFTGVDTLPAMLGRNLGLTQNDVCASDQVYSNLIDSLGTTFGKFLSGDPTSGVVVMRRNACGSLEDASDDIGCFRELSGAETLILPTDVSSACFQTVVRICVDLRPAAEPGGAFGVRRVYLGNWKGDAITGLNEISGVSFRNIDEFPFAIKAALGYEPHVNYSPRLFEATCSMLTTGALMSEVDLDEPSKRGKTVAVIIRRQSEDEAVFELSLRVGDEEHSVSSLVRERMHTLTSKDVSNEIAKLKAAVNKARVQPIHLRHLFNEAAVCVKGGEKKDCGCAFEIGITEAVNVALRDGRFDLHAGYDKRTHREFIGGLFAIRYVSPGSRIRCDGATSDCYLNTHIVADRLDFISIVSPAEAARMARRYNRLVHDLASDKAAVNLVGKQK